MTLEIEGVYIDARDKVAARELCSSLLPMYRQFAVADTDFWAAYGIVTASGSGKRNGENQLYRKI